MSRLTHQRCFNHAQREAAAHCLGCGQFFCRECVTEHDDRVLCAVCLQKLVKPPVNRRRSWVGVARFFQCLFGLLLLWFFFYLAGEWLISQPSSFHEGTLWSTSWHDDE